MTLFCNLFMEQSLYVAFPNMKNLKYTFCMKFNSGYCREFYA